MTVSQWANSQLKLSAEDSAEPGQFDTARAPFQAGIMDAVSEPRVHTVVVMSSAQIGKTVILKAIIGFHVDQDPAPILMLQPTEQMAEAFSKDRLAPMIRDTPALRGKIADPRARDSGNSILHKRFTGGHLTLAGSNSPASLASRPIRVVLCDEVDRYPASAGTEGDPVNLAVKRTSTFWNRRIVLTSTPTIKGASRIEFAYNNSDQRRYYVPCPHCGNMHTLKWADVQWPEREPEGAFMVCTECGGMIEEKHKAGMLAHGEWRAELPCKGVAGFHVNELYSPWRTWAQVAVDFMQAKQSPETLKTWINTSLGETWEEAAEKSDPETLLGRRENYTSETIPDSVRYLTAGVDTQDDRLEIEIVGWNQTSRDTPPESWGIEYRVIHGDPAKMDVWLDLDKVLQTTFKTQNQRNLRVQATCIDSGGHHTAAVYAYCSTRQGQHIYPTKGLSGAKPIWTPKAAKSRKYQALVWHIGVDSGKDAWYSRLRIKDPGPGYCHFPLAYDQHFFDMLTSEQVRTKYSKGRPIREWFLPSGRRNEALDIRVLALAALLARPINWDSLKSDSPPRNSPAPKAAPRNSFINRPAGIPWIR
jgi:phage terminase large subunit GpA-like protein